MYTLANFFRLDLFLFIFVFVIYLHNISIGVYGGDSGDFISTIATLGVPHPSGFPLYMILGILFSKLSVFPEIARNIGILSAFFSALSVVFIYHTSRLLTGNKIISLISALLVAFYYVFWLYAEIVEVFALNNFFITLLIYLGVRFYLYAEKKVLYILALSCGLALSNHEIIIAVFPSVTILVISNLYKKYLRLRTVSICLLLFFIGLLPYLYIPLVAMTDPIINTGHATTLENFIHVVLRKDYGWEC
jgi:4-amino-4-deoxy-L-arabinose transferase-like glycosyltransferase